MSFVVVMVLLLVVMYVLMIRPQRQRQAQQQAMIDGAGVGDDILTTPNKKLENILALVKQTGELPSGVTVRADQRHATTTLVGRDFLERVSQRARAGARSIPTRVNRFG